MARSCVLAAWIIAGAVFYCRSSAGAENYPDRDTPSRWLPLYNRTAAEYQLFRNSEHRVKLELKAEPIYKWTANSADGANGAVYVWTHRGCAEAVGCFWLWPPQNGAGGNGSSLRLAHELHSLSPMVLKPVREGPTQWTPKAALPRAVLDGAPVPVKSAARRLAQMRAIGQDFSAHSLATDGERRELRLLTTPLYRYKSADPEVDDGALFAFVCTVGTDPEAFLVLEARRTTEGPRWHYALARFSHLDLFVNYQDREVWRSVRGPDDDFAHNADHTYRCFGEPVAEQP